MEAEFDLAEKRREKERKDAERIRKAREAEQAAAKKIVEEAEKKRQLILDQQREKERRRRDREEEELLQSGGIDFSRFYRPVPMANLETDKIKLPASALEALSSSGAIEGGRILAFELALFDESTETIVSKTNCGVSEFTAAEGTVEVPVKAAMSLTRTLGEAALIRFKVRVRYVSVDRFDRVRARVQPLGHGFHLEGEKEVSIDLKSLLERALSKQTILSEGDWIPVRHDGRTYVLAVRELLPDSQCTLINTDVEIDLMPSEEAEREMIKRENLERLRKERADRAKALMASLPSEPSQGGITVRARLPGSLTATRRFDPEVKLSVVFNWAESMLGEVERPPRVDCLEIVQSMLPGQSRVLSPRDLGTQTLREVGFARTENLNFRWSQPDDSKMDIVGEEEKTTEKEEQRQALSAEGDDWSAIKASAESSLDRDLSSSANASPQPPLTTPGDGDGSGGSDSQSLVSSADIFRLLVKKGAEPMAAGRACQRYLSALRSIVALNLVESNGSGAQAVAVVDKFKGSIERSADAMMTWVAEDNGMSVEPSQGPHERWGEQVEILQAMFTGREKDEIVQALHKHGGSVQHAVNELLQSS